MLERGEGSASCSPRTSYGSFAFAQDDMDWCKPLCAAIHNHGSFGFAQDDMDWCKALARPRRS
jgi:hypothetical protein